MPGNPYVPANGSHRRLAQHVRFLPTADRHAADNSQVESRPAPAAGLGMTRRASEVKIPLLRSRSAQKAENSPASGECVLLQRRRRTPTFKVMPGRVDFFVRKSIFL